MCPNSNETPRQHCWLTSLRIVSVIALLCLAGHAAPTRAQNGFNSGSTGADGAFAPSANQTLAVPASGVFNFTTVNVPAGVTITFTRNTQNTPVTILASGNVTITGSLVVSGQPGNASGNGGAGGSGGFDGGIGGFGLDTYSGNPGNGPGGGGAGKKGANYGGGGGGGGFNGVGGVGSSQSPGAGGPRYGTSTLLPLIGGSGGGGGGAAYQRGASGGGGGGAILIASSGSVIFSGSAAINAPGGNGGPASNGSDWGAGGGGSGGAIRLIANTISGSAVLNVSGGAGGSGCWYGGCGGAGAPGYLRVEAYDYGSFTPNVAPSAISYAAPNPVTLPTTTQLRIASVAGVAAPGSPLGSFQGVPDVIVSASQANPVSVALEGVNIPVGTVVQVTLTPTDTAPSTVSSSPLAGSSAASTGTASVNLPTGVSVITATATVDLTLASARPMFIDGERVNRIEVAAVYGGSSRLTYITQSGRRISR